MLCVLSDFNTSRYVQIHVSCLIYLIKIKCNLFRYIVLKLICMYLKFTTNLVCVSLISFVNPLCIWDTYESHSLFLCI